ncbi:MAG: DEAD/DEAH box helicase family protein [Hydrococcus sp. Prado102]|jgi:superfamily I DNA and RNA helicase|nr:DEAD/DEAH box helicase family protein [Hydrococcus sp. Prado102]
MVINTVAETLLSTSPREIPEGTPIDSPIRVIHHLESGLKTLDEQQQEIATKYPDGPQRLRGLAGTGKTILLAKRAAKIHHEHPEWKIAFVFFTKSLYDQIRKNRIRSYYGELTNGQEPNWDNLNVLHAWGGKEQNGFYRHLTNACGLQPKTVKDVENEIGKVSPGGAFKYVCNMLELELTDCPILYDAILIDEAQDLPASFYRLARNTLTEAKRLYWAYDEAQGIDSLIVPDAAKIFGRHPDGTPIVDLGLASNRSFFYEGTNIRKSENLNKCYRTPKLLLMAAHAIHMGLLRKEGVLQGVSNREEWKKLGYEVLEGDFTDASIKEKKSIKIERQAEKSPHPIDQENFVEKEGVGETLIIETFADESEEQEWIARQVALDLKKGLQPSDITITALGGEKEQDYFRRLQETLKYYGVKSCIVGVDSDASEFGKSGCVTITNVYRAKGNEAWKVYVARFHYATKPIRWKNESELQKRNEAFVAMTRTRVWCVVTGLENPVFDELRMAKEQFPILLFPAFNKNSLKRVTDEQGND